VTTIAANQERYVNFLAVERQLPGVALVVVCVAGKEGMRIDASVKTNPINLAKRRGTTAVISPGAGRILRRVAESRVMRGQHDRALVVLVFDALQLGC
jgi:hypothetical protein